MTISGPLLKIAVIIFTLVVLLSCKVSNARYRTDLAQKKDEVSEGRMEKWQVMQGELFYVKRQSVATEEYI